VVKQFQFGSHTWDIFPSNYDPIIRFLWIGDIIYLIGIIFTKFSILYWYCGIFRVNRKFVLTCYGIMAFCFVYCLVFIFIYGFACQPYIKTWNVYAVEGKCFDMLKVLQIIGGFNLVTDTIILFLPLPLISRLKLRLRQKLGVLAVLATGAVVVGATIVRQVIVITVLSNADQAWGTVDHILWLTVEHNVGIMCGCFLVATPLYKYVLGGEIFGRSVHNNRESNMRENSTFTNPHHGVFTGRIWAGESEIELGESYQSSVDSSQQISGIVQTKSVEVAFSSPNPGESEETIQIASEKPVV